MNHNLDIAAVRAQFPALARRVADHPVAYFDGPAGSQVPFAVADAMRDYLLHHNGNTHGAFVTSAETDALVEDACQAGADFLGAPDAACIAWGPNMTSLTFQLSRSLAREWKPGDEVIVTKLDHDANVSPWVLAAQDAGATVHKVAFDPSDCTLDLAHLASLLCERTRLVAVGAASNAVGSVNPLRAIADLAHAVGAEVFVDAVHYAPHGLIDVVDWDCDFLACSPYKFFGPHMGMLWGRRARLEALRAYRVRPAGDGLPGKWMTGTASFEGIAGSLAAIDYIAGLTGHTGTRRDALVAAFAAITAHERALLTQLLTGLAEIPAVRVWGIGDPARNAERVPTVSITHADHTPRAVAESLGDQGIFVWHGNYYALELTETLDLEPDGMVRIGILHYNTADEVARLLEALRALR